MLNACPPRGSWTAQAAEAVRGFGLALCPVTLGRTAQEAEQDSPAAREIEALYRFCRRR